MSGTGSVDRNIHVKWVSRGDHEGYGVAGRDYVRLLAGAGLTVTWEPYLDDPEDWRRVVPGALTVEDSVLLRCRETPGATADVTVLHLFPGHLVPLIDVERAAGRRVVGYVTWETGRLPAGWPEILNRLDAVLVPCRWNAEVFAAGGVTQPIHVVPHLAMSPLPHGSEGATSLLGRLPGSVRARIARGDVVVYSIGTFTRRKGIDAVLKAYARAFAGRDDVLLLLKTSQVDFTRWRRGLPLGWHKWRPAPTKTHPSAKAGARKVLRGHRAIPPLHVIADTDLSDVEISALHELGQVYLALPRSEGWGLGGFEAALRGRPVIMTGASGQVDYLDEDLAWRVGHHPVPAREPTWDIPYGPEDLWAEPDVEHAARLLREVTDDLPRAQERAAQLATRLQERFSSAQVLSSLIAAWEPDPHGLDYT